MFVANLCFTYMEAFDCLFLKMARSKQLLWIVALVAVFSCREKGEKPVPIDKPEGLAGDRSKLSSILTKSMPDSIPALETSAEFSQALYYQARFLLNEGISARPVPGISRHDLLETVHKLQAWQHLQPTHLSQYFDFYRINTELKNDKVRITGYYTPVIQANRERNSRFSIPVYKKPSSEELPSAAAIEAGALTGKGLELAWLRSKKELRHAQLQGSCVLAFPDGKQKFLGFGGSVKKGANSDSTAENQGGSYVFFQEMGDRAVGAGGFELSNGYSIATDTRHIPLGSCLLAELPNIAPDGKQKGNTYRIVFAQDVGGAIRTTKRIDLYTGVGEKGLAEAAKINRYGRMWLLLPKQ